MSEEFDKDGFLAKRFGSKANKRRIGKQKWRVYYVNLIGSSLHYYKDIDDVEPKDTIQLKGFKLATDDSQGSRKKYTILLKNDKEDNYLFSCEDESDWKEWTTAITNAFDKPTKPPLTKEKKKGRIEQLANKAKKNVAGKVATSALGKKAIRSHAPEEVKNLIKSINTLVEQESKGSKKAGEIEENIFKIGIKSYFLVDEGKVTIDDILQADVPLRKALEILCKCFDHAKYSRKVDQNALQQRFTEAQKLGVEAGQILTKCVEPHLKPHNVARINETLTYLLNPEFLLKVFLDEKLDDALQELISAAEHYTQFHFYSEK